METGYERLLTAREVAARLGVSVRTVHAWMRSGRLPSLKLSARGTRVPASALGSFLREAEARGHPTRPRLDSVLWDVAPGTVDEERHSRLLIRRILESGRPDQVAWLFQRYTRDLILEVALHDQRLPPRVAAAWVNLLGTDGTA
jgi:excisionase family DNA binding protein